VVPDSFALMVMEWAVLVLGVTWGRSWSNALPRRTVVSCGLMLACWAWLCLASIPLFVRLVLTENSYVSQVWLLLPMRLLFAGLVLGPIAFCVGWVFNLSRMNILAVVEDDTNPTRQRGRTLHGAPSRIQSMERSPSLARRVSVGIFKCVVLGREENRTRLGTGWRETGPTLIVLLSATVTSWVLPIFGVWTLVTFATSVLMAVSAVACDWAVVLMRIRGIKSAGMWARVGQGVVGTMIVFAVSAPAWVRYQPTLAAKVLFDTTVFVAHRAGAAWEQLPVMDDCRPAVVVESDRGTLTAWKSHGAQFLVRENGIPKGTLATNAQLVARYVPDLLPSVLPLVIHEQPQRVLLLGLRAGEPLAATTAFPVQRVLCLEADRGVLGLCRVLMGGSADDQSPLTPNPSPRRGEGRNNFQAPVTS
ncbi:MAG TPA: hypothetical protein VK137_03755, partial [Planctomycetaceae bacterium]|nr:hypothetical protein [Planctomycetaceae bacterium]